MPFDFGSSVNQIHKKFIGIPIVHKIMTNPIFTALLICFVIILFAMLAFRGTDELVRKSLRLSVYSFFAVSFIIFMHNKLIFAEINDKKRDDTFETLFSPTNGGSDLLDDLDDNIQIMPVEISKNIVPL